MPYLDIPCLAPLEVVIINKSKRRTERGFSRMKISNRHAVLQMTDERSDAYSNWR